MARISRTVAFLAMIAAPLQAYADDRNGYFPTDILAVGRSYATFATMHTSEHRHVTFRNVPGDYDKQLTIESATIRHGLFENVDLTLGMAYNSQYKSTQFYANGASATSNRPEGWANPVFSISYGLLNNTGTPFSLKFSLIGSQNINGKSTSYLEPILILGYKFNETARSYASVWFYLPTRENYVREVGLKIGGQYDFTDSFTLDVVAGHRELSSAGAFRSYQVNYAGAEGIFKIADNFYIAPSVTLAWGAKITSIDNLMKYAPGSRRSYFLSLKHLF